MKSKILFEGFVLVLLSGFLAACVSAETPKLWSRTIGGSGIDDGASVAVDFNDNIVVAGDTNSFGAGGYDFWTVKYDSNGNLLWNRTIGGSSTDSAHSVALDLNNNIVVVGSTYSFGAGSGDFWVVKYDSNGNLLWNRTVGGSNTDIATGVAVDLNNNIIVAGYTKSFGVGGYDFWTVKCDSNGNVLWNVTMGGVDYDKVNGVAVDSNNNIIVVGTTNSSGAGSYDIWTIKYNSSGSPLWNKTIGGAYYEGAKGVTIDSNNNIIIVGDTNSFGVGSYDFWIIKYNSSGSPLWNRTIGSLSIDYSGGVTVDSYDNILLTGHTYYFGAGGTDIWTVKYDPDGNLQWNGTLGGGSNDYGYAITVDSNNNIIVVANTRSFGVGNNDVWIVKYGTPLCYDGIDNDGNGVADCMDAECTSTPDCSLWAKSFTPQPTIVTLQGKLTNSSSGAVITTASMRVTISNSTGQVWSDTFNNTLTNGVFNIPLGASKELNLIKDNVYSMKVDIDVGSTSFVAVDVSFGEGLVAGDVIKFTA